MGSMEFTYHLAAARVAPWGEHEADRRAALIAAEIANWSGYAKQRTEITNGLGRLQGSRETERRARTERSDVVLREQMRRARHAGKRWNRHR